ncbi:DNA-binding transcriptional regulator, AcrR family [Amycolatopsis xylanica]|uniref:DNA-binding transcriptional regulator, AcrR family n=1 Tax=Amycolatopsis xylanica TaxID=589385 RepID=A0A1H3LBQ3_9PSEU|nr:DNA-binding transcriptional regulator, AcrR family [Amycolatopsis xylanica]
MAAARELFATRGYAAVPADEIVRAAGVTRGALYHHYGDKQGLFRAVFEEVEREVTAEVDAAMAGAPDLASGMVIALGAFLDACGREEVRRISLTDAPAVLGWTEWRAIEAEHGLGLVTEVLSGAVEAGSLPPLPVDVLAQLVLSAVTEAALLIANAEDPVATRAASELALMAWFRGLTPG